MTAKPQHRPTPTQRLRAQLAALEAENVDLETENADLKAVLAKPAETDDSVFERRFPITGHSEGPAAYVAMHRYGNTWAVIDSNGGRFAPSWFDGRHWHDLDGCAPRNAMYRFTYQQAEELAENFAKTAAERHHRNALLAQLSRIEEHANEGLTRHAERMSA
jgi:hypothetical protein